MAHPAATESTMMESTTMEPVAIEVSAEMVIEVMIAMVIEEEKGASERVWICVSIGVRAVRSVMVVAPLVRLGRLRRECR